MGLCCASRLKGGLPLFPDGSEGLCDRCAKSGAAVKDGDADLNLCDLPLEVSRHAALAHPFYTMHPPTECIHRPAAVCLQTMKGLVSRYRRRRYRLHRGHSARPKQIDALTASLRAVAPVLGGVQGLAFPARRYDGLGIARQSDHGICGCRRRHWR